MLQQVEISYLFNSVTTQDRYLTRYDAVMLLNIVFFTLIATLMRNDFSLKLQAFGYTVHLVCPGSDWTYQLLHPTPPQPPAPYSLPGWKTHCHSFHVRFLVKSECSLRHRGLLFLLRGSGLCCFFGTLVRACINL